MAEEITTKCICIIRHKKGNKKAKVYNVEIKKRGKNLYNFIKGEEIKNNVAKEIEERNKLINDLISKKTGCNYEKYF